MAVVFPVFCFNTMWWIHSQVLMMFVLVSEGKRGTFSELTGSMSRAAGKKINRIITFSKKKPPLPGEPHSCTSHHDNPRCGEDTVKQQITYQIHANFPWWEAVMSGLPKLPLMRNSYVWSSSSLHRLPGCVSEWLVEGALVCGARWKPVPAEGPGPTATACHGAAQRCRGGTGGPRP